MSISLFGERCAANSAAHLKRMMNGTRQSQNESPFQVWVCVPGYGLVSVPAHLFQVLLTSLGTYVAQFLTYTFCPNPIADG